MNETYDSLILTEEEQAVLDGKSGPGPAMAMELVTSVGRAYEARRLIEVSSVHISGISYQNIGPSGAAFVREILTGVDRFAVPTTLNPCGMDLEQAEHWGLDPDFVAGQIALVDTLTRAGAEPLLTCTPYLAGVNLAPGTTVAWAESSALSWANSVLGLRTNRIGGPEALASAVVGRTAEYGLLLDENRLPTLRVEMEQPISGRRDFGALGVLIGRHAKGGIPAIALHRDQSMPSPSELLSLAAAMAAAGSVALFYVDSFTPPPPATVDRDTLPLLNLESLDQDPGLSTGQGEVDLVAFGCPHASLADMEDLLKAFRSKEVQTTTWVMTSRVIRDRAREAGIVQKLEAQGVTVVCDTCVVSTPLARLGFSHVALDSAKAASYLPSHCGVEVTFTSTEECVRMATS